MEPFEPLRLPLPEQVFEDFKGMWFVRALAPESSSFLIRDTKELEVYEYDGGDVDPSVEKFYFDNAWEAHEAAMEYHARYNEDYPYMSSYLASGGTTERADMIMGNNTNTDVESQVMDFA